MIQLPNKNLENTNTKQVKTECTKWCEAVHLSPLSQQLATAFSSEPRNQEPKNQEPWKQEPKNQEPRNQRIRRSIFLVFFFGKWTLLIRLGAPMDITLKPILSKCSNG